MHNPPKIFTSAENADNATAASVEVITRRPSRKIGARDSSAASLSEAVIPVYRIARNRAIMTRCDTSRLNALRARLRNTPPPRVEYDRLATFWAGAYLPSLPFLAGMVFGGDSRRAFSPGAHLRLGRPPGRPPISGGEGDLSTFRACTSPPALLRNFFRMHLGRSSCVRCGRLRNLKLQLGINQANTWQLPTKPSRKTP